jgi:hypothetical protein
MNILVAIILFCSGAFANEVFGHKRGFVLGIGGNISTYTYPVQFSGVSKNKVDDSSTLFGPSLNIGYDFVLGNRFLLGLRTDGFIVDTLGTGATETSKVTDKTKGKIRAGSLALRLGTVFDFHTVDMVGQNTHLIGEFFFEGGVSSGHKSFSKEYSTTDGVTESYNENLEEEFQGRILAAGFNVTTGGGTFFEIKFMQTSIEKNKQTFVGTEIVNGGASSPTSKKLENENLKSLSSILMTVGHHY